MNLRWPALVVAAGLAAGLGYQLYLQRAPQREAPPPVDQGTPAPTLVEVLPEVRLADREGELRSLSDWPDRALIINFWATWCAPCRREIPLLQQIQRERGPDGFQVIGIAVDFRDKVLAYAEEMSIEYPLLIGEQEALDAAAAFGLDAIGFPFTVFTDRSHRVVAAHLGELEPAEAEVILAAVEGVDAGRLTPEQARADIETALATLLHDST
jgi:thiol-disulfide isomerase/thioredoxin